MTDKTIKSQLEERHKMPYELLVRYHCYYKRLYKAGMPLKTAWLRMCSTFEKYHPEYLGLRKD